MKTLAIVESSNGINVIGDGGRSLGIFQISKGCLADYNRINKTNYQHREMFNKTKAEMVATWYLKHYGRIYKKRTNKRLTIGVLATIYNAGLRGCLKGRGKQYKKRFLKIYNEINDNNGIIP